MLYPLTRMMWGEKGFWDMLPPVEPGGGYPIKMIPWMSYVISFGVKSKILKDYISDIKLTSFIEHLLNKEFGVFSNLKKTLLEDIPIKMPPFSKLNKTFNIFSLIKKDFNMDVNVNLISTNNNLNIVNLLNNLKYLDLANYVD